MSDYIRGAFDPIAGLVSLRIGRRYFKFKAPWNGELFSERHGFERTIWRCAGWRLLERTLS